MFQAAVGTPIVYFHNQPHAFVHGHGQGLRAAHFPQSGSKNPFAAQGGPARLPRRGGKCFICALQNTLRANVNPASRRHLPIHDQPFSFPFIEIFLGSPVRHNVGVGNEDARGIGMGAENGNRLAALHEQRFIILKLAQRFKNGVKCIPIAGGAPPSAVDDEVFGVAGDFGVEVVLQHAVGGLLQPSFAVQFGANRSADNAFHVILLLRKCRAIFQIARPIWKIGLRWRTIFIHGGRRQPVKSPGRLERPNDEGRKTSS